jgi:hypothetical protein
MKVYGFLMPPKYTEKGKILHVHIEIEMKIFTKIETYVIL